MRVVAKHVFGSLYDCDEEVLKNEEKLVNTIKKSAEIANSKLISVYSYKFGGFGGVSAIAIVAESHISIHTYPEYRYALVDVFTCGAYTEPEKAFDYIAKELKAKNVIKKIENRSLE
ncbi:MAG: adenosylmethionine decarboxylase [Candidatus Aenigmatarchaeota archaeon]